MDEDPGGEPPPLYTNTQADRKSTTPSFLEAFRRIFLNPEGVGPNDGRKCKCTAYSRLFQTDPALRNYFQMLEGVEDSQLAQNPQFRAHVIRVMHSLDAAVGHLHEPDVVVAMLHKLGTAHHKHRVHRKDFEVFKSVVVVMFSELGFSEATMDAWDRTFTFFFKHIYEKLDKTYE